MKVFNFQFYLLVLGVLFILLNKGCSGKRDVRLYYLPINELRNGKVYEYRPVGADSLAPYYWYYQTVAQKDSVWLSGNYYDSRMETKQLTKELRTDAGMALKELRLYSTAPDGKSVSVNATIAAGAVFPFQVTDSLGVFIYNITFSDPSDAAHHTNLIRNRRFMKDTVYSYKNKSYDAIIMEVKEALRDDKNGSWEHTFHYREIYAKGIGPVDIKRDLENGTYWEYALYDVYDMATLEKKYSLEQKK